MKRIIFLLIVIILARAEDVAGQCTLTSGAGTDGQTVCVNTSITAITYTITGATGGSVTGGALPAGVTTSFTAPTFTISGAPTASGTFNYTISLTGPTPCSSAGTITVNPLPTISGTLSVCAGSATTLSGSGTPDATTPWSSASTGVATVTSGGVVTGVSAGTSVITYKDDNGCTNTATVTVNAIPSAPTGNAAQAFCDGATVADLTTSSGSGIKWYDAASAGSLYLGTDLLADATHYFASQTVTGCESTDRLDVTATVNPLPAISGTLTVCAGSTTTLSGSGTPDATTPWSSASTGIATVTSGGLVSGIAAGTSVITYKDNNGCTKTATVTVYALPTITGTLTVCEGSTTTLTGSGTPDATTPWSSSATGIATVTNLGVVTGLSAGTSDITYKNSNGCTKTETVTVNAIPSAPTGNAAQIFCDGATVADLTTSSGSGIKWYDAASAGSLYLGTDLLADATHYFASQTVTGCESTNRLDVTVTIHPLPTISGTLTVCAGSTTTLIGSGTPDATTPWSSESPGIATVTGGGVVNGIAAGTSVITYKDNNGCTKTATVTVNPIPVPVITGANPVCITSSITYSTEAGKSSYDWEFTGGTLSGGGDGNNTVTIIWNTLGAQTVSVKYTSLGCPAAAPTVYNVTVQDKPSPTSVQINGTLKKGQTINTSYSYIPGVCFAEDLSKTEIRWYRDDNGTDPGSTMIIMKYATDKTYTIVNDDKNKWLKVGVKLSDGTSLRDEVFSIWYGPVGDNAPVATNVDILGNVRSGLAVYGTYTYTDEDNDSEGTSTFKWYSADDAASNGKTLIPGATLRNYTINHSFIGKYLGFEVTPVATGGTITGLPVVTSPFKGPIQNSAPTASSVGVAGVLQEGQVLTGLYTYNDIEGDLESGSTFKWYSSTTSGGTFTATGETGRSRIIAHTDQGKYFKFSVVPKAATGTQNTSEFLSPESGRVNSQPSASVGAITAAPSFEVGNELTGHYTLNDDDGDPTSATFRWLRTGGLAISGATSDKYTLTPDDEGYTIRFEVTPHASSGYPTTGDIVLSPATVAIPISPSSPKPIATDVCIQGIRDLGEVLTARYTYSFSRTEGSSVRKWYRGTTEIGSGMTYTLNATDIASTQDITFAVTPVSSGTPSQGTKVTSSALARITLTQLTYPENVESVTLTASPTGGVFAGSFVTNGIFSPKNAGADTTVTISYSYIIVNTSNTCSQSDSADLSVIPASTQFGSVKSVYCKNDAIDQITVDNIPAGAIPYTPYGFFINSVYNKTGIVSGSENLLPNPYSGTAPWTVNIDPAALNVGTSYLYLYYNYLGYYYLLRADLYVEQVGTLTEISNLRTDYCAEDPQQNIQVYGLYPPGGTAVWTSPGTFVTDKDQLIAKVNPGNISPGGPYTVTYQYTTPNGCKSNILSKDVTVNPMPDASFNLDPSYNVEGPPFTLVASIPYGGAFLGDGISGNTLFPNLAGTGPKNIVYKITDINNCIDEVTKSTVIRKAMGTINGLSGVECYSNLTKSITVTGLPVLPDVVNIVNFTNKKNSIVWTPGSTSALYNIAAARAGYDTLTFSYTWDGVPYSIKHGVYIDSIGNIEITGLKDNYCDYEGTATLRVLVENSTGSGNFSFSGPGTAFANYGLLADFYPSLAPPSATPYTVSYTHVSTVNGSGCTKVASLPVTVNKSPDVSIINSRITVNVKEIPLILSGLPTEGVFSGKGVYKSGDDYVFDPEVAGLGNVEFALTYTDSKSCTTVKKDTFIVSAASGSILGLNPNNQYCYDGLKDTLTYSSSKPWYNGSFSGAGITDLGSAKAQFDPASAGKGDHDIIFTYFDQYNTQFEVSSIVNVDSLGVVEIKPIADGEEYCENDTPIELITTPRGGTFTGPVTTGYFTPSKALGDTAITYTYLNVRTGCSITGRVPFTIHPAPVVTFMPSDLCIENMYDSIRFINSTTSADAVSTWLWSFSDIGGTDYSSRQTPAYLFKSGGQHLITLSATTVNNCIVKKDLTYDLGVKPVADILWKNECFVPGDSILIYDNTVSTSEVKSRTWNFFDGNPLKTGTTVYYPKNAVGPIQVQYIVETNYANCSDTVTKSIYVRPNIVLSTDGYFEDFETGSGGWSRGDEELNSWTFGTPDRTVIKSASSGTSAWFTKFDTVLTEHSSVISPCFDFTNIERPMVSMGLWRNFNKDRDGAALQFRIGDSGTWLYVGTYGDGISWYNSVLIDGKPGGDKLGWTSDAPDRSWIEARHTLDDLRGKKDVKFRMAYGSDGYAKDNDGLAFDDIFIGERKRTVLVEHFANISSLTSSEATGMIDQVDQAIDKDIANIQYHTNFPGIDSFYVNNPGDASARILFYGLTKAPYTFVDGGTRNDYAIIFDYSTREFDNSLTAINSNDIIRRGLIAPVFDIELDSLDISGGVLTVNGKITSQEADTISNLTLYIAVIEKINTTQTGAGGETTFRNVFRKFIPDAAGIVLPGIWSSGMTYEIKDLSWIIQKTLNASDIEVVVFVQNNVTKEVYQAASMLKPKISVGIEKPGIINKIDFALYPNPAKHQLTIRFGEPLDMNTDIFVYDFGGMIIKTFKAGSGETEFVIDDLGLKDGIYLIRVSSGGVNFGFKKLIISGS